MPAPAPAPPAALLATPLAELRRGCERDRRRSFGERAALARACLQLVGQYAAPWAAASAQAKGGSAAGARLAEEWASGPLVVARLLAQFAAVCDGLAAGRLPPVRTRRAASGMLAVPAAPRGIVDRLVLPGYRAEVHVPADAPLQREPPSGGQGVHVVLGAGNVSSMPLGDTLTAVFLRGAAVLLKASPLHSELLPLFRQVLAPLIAHDLVRIVVGGAELGAAAAAHPGVDAWHLTGAPATLQTLGADPAAAGKPWTAELGNVTPVLLVPGRWRPAELQATALHLAALLADNGACNCVTPRLLLTCRQWPQRAGFLAGLSAALAAWPPRAPFHPGARQRFEKFAGNRRAAERLPFVLRTDADLGQEPWLAAEESFAPVLVETAVPGDDVRGFLERAVACVHDRSFGGLAAQLFAPPRVLARDRPAIDAAAVALRHGTIAINTWAALGYALGHTPWGTGGACPPPGTGRGTTHNTLLLAAPLRSIVQGPFRPWPRPPWLRAGDATGLLAAITELHVRPRPGPALRLLARAVRP